jgi:hypothetical protein
MAAKSAAESTGTTGDQGVFLIWHFLHRVYDSKHFSLVPAKIAASSPLPQADDVAASVLPHYNSRP